LKIIQMECNSILATLKKDLKRKFLHWSGRLNSLNYDDSGHGTSTDNDDTVQVPTMMTTAMTTTMTIRTWSHPRT
jgi:hypothetical protein